MENSQTKPHPDWSNFLAGCTVLAALNEPLGTAGHAGEDDDVELEVRKTCKVAVESRLVDYLRSFQLSSSQHRQLPEYILRKTVEFINARPER
jgi:hypothetical protein